MHEYEWYDIIESNWKYESKVQETQVNTHERDQELQSLIDENSPKNPKYKKFAEENNKLAKESLQKIKEILTQECWIKFNSEFDSSITWAEIYDSWSTWRWTDIPTKDVDLDFTLLLDAKDYERVEEIKKIIHEKIWTQKNDDHEVQEWWNQIKSKINNLWKSKERPNWIPLDLLILKKSQVIEYSSSDAMKEKLNIIWKNSESWPKDLNRVKTNIIIMKKLLKAMWCYKKPEWWMSWIWVENWILQNHWSFVEALESFEQIAYWWIYKEWKQAIPLKEFQKLYPIFDAWENYKDWCNDNFVYKLNENWYSWTLKIIQTYRIEWIEWIKKLIKQYEDKKLDFIGWDSNQYEYNDTDYFDWKSHQFEVTEAQARSNSENMDKILSEINEQNKSKKLEELRKNISEQYKEATWEELNLTDEQLLSILDAHEQDWKLWELTLWELRQKVKILDETITDPKVRRFLLEAGFCGKVETFTDTELTDITNKLKKYTSYNNFTIEEITNFCIHGRNWMFLEEKTKYIEKIIENGIEEKYIPHIIKKIEINLPNFRNEILSYYIPERKPVWKNEDDQYKQKNDKRKKEQQSVELKKINIKEKLGDILDKSMNIDNLKSIDSLPGNEQKRIIEHAKEKFKREDLWLRKEFSESDPVKSFIAECFYDSWFEIFELEFYYHKEVFDIYELENLDAIINYGKNQISNTIPDEIFDINRIRDVLKNFGYIPSKKWGLIPNIYLKDVLGNERWDFDSKILNEEDIKIMSKMINIGNHKDFRKSLTPQIFLRTFYQFKSMFEKRYVWWVRESFQFTSLIDREGKEFFDKILSEYEKSSISKEEVNSIHDFVANSHRKINEAMINWYTGTFREKWENLRRLIQRFPVDETIKLNRTERDCHRFDEVKLKDWTTLTQIMQNIEQYENRIDEINKELRWIPLHNKAFMSTAQGHLHNPMWNTGWDQINWLIYLEKGSHALFRNIYSQTSQWELEYIVQADSDITFQIEIVDVWGTKFPKLIGYVKTP